MLLKNINFQLKMSVQLSIDDCRSILIDHFDNVSNEIDLFVEEKMRANFGDEVKSGEINEKREIMLKEVREAEQLNMKHLNENLVNDLDSLAGDISKLFVEYCFVLKFNKQIHLVLSNEHVHERALSIYKRIIDAEFTGNFCVEQRLLEQIFEIGPFKNKVKFSHVKHNVNF